MSNLGAPRIATGHGGKPKARGAGQPPRKYTLWEWTQGYIALVLTFPLFLLFACLSGRQLPAWAVRKLLRSHERTTASRPRDVRIPYDPSIRAYMRRWWKIRRNAFLNVYYHNVMRSDDDRAHHDHPWWSFSIVLEGGYFEHRIKAGGVHTRIWYGPGTMLFRRSGKIAHRLELKSVTFPELMDYIWHWPIGRTEELHADARGMVELPSKTIFITGPVLRRWGFHDSKRWVDAYEWDDYCAANGTASMPMAGYAEQLKKDH